MTSTSGAIPSDITMSANQSIRRNGSDNAFEAFTPAGTGTVTDVSVVSANGLAGTVATSTTTPAITLSTTITGVLKGNGTAISAASSTTDYVAPNAAIVGATKTKITYDTKGLVTSGADATTADIADSTNKRYVTDANLTVIGNTSNSNTGDQTISDATISITDITTNNASTSAHGFVTKATAPAANILNVVGIANGETLYTNKALFDATSPSTQAFGDAASAGTSLIAAHRDHKHAMPATPKDTTAITGMLKGNGSTISAGTAGTDYYSSLDAIPSANIPNGITNLSTGNQGSIGSAGVYTYLTGSALTMPATSKAGGGMSTSTNMKWQFMLRKTAAGTASNVIAIYRGTTGTVASDTRDVTQSIGVATAAVDIMTVFVTLQVTATGATGSYTWSISCHHKAATAAGFGVTDATPFFTGTVSSVAMNTASLIFGIAFMNTTGTAVVLCSGMTAQVNNMT